MGNSDKSKKRPIKSKKRPIFVQHFAACTRKTCFLPIYTYDVVHVFYNVKQTSWGLKVKGH
jgi:hypothetical protein